MKILGNNICHKKECAIGGQIADHDLRERKGRREGDGGMLACQARHTGMPWTKTWVGQGSLTTSVGQDFSREVATSATQRVPEENEGGQKNSETKTEINLITLGCNTYVPLFTKESLHNINILFSQNHKIVKT